MTHTRKIAGYALMACALAAGAWMTATALGSGNADPTEATPAATDEFPAAEVRFVEPTAIDYGAHLQPR
jgi:hypothetical protein